MKKSTGPASTVHPEPVFMVATYNDDGTPNAMVAAWGGIANDRLISICIDKGHKTAANVMKHRAFTVSMADESHVIACDYLGMVSGKDIPDKFSKSGFHATRSDLVDAPLIDELCMCLECEMVSYEDETLIGRILDIKADESILTDGRVDVEKLNPLVYDPIAHTYRTLGPVVGRAHMDGKKLE